MANRIFKCAVIFILLVFSSLTRKIYAQTESPSQRNLHLSQKLEWKSESEAFEYKVEIKNSSGFTREFTTENTSIVFSMPAGTYEWRVTAIDFLGRESTQTAWKKFTISKAITPTVRTKVDRIVLDKETEVTIPVEVNKISGDAKIELVDTKTDKAIPGKIENDSAVFKKVPDGNYKIKITNPGGFSAESYTMNIREKTAEERRIEREAKEAEERRIAEEERKRLEEEKRLAREERRNRPRKDIYFMGGAEYLLNLTENEVFLDKKTMIGGNFKFEMLPIKIKGDDYKLGFNLKTSVFPTTIDSPFSDEYLIAIPLNLNLAFYKVLVANKIMVGVNAGGGAIGLLHIENFHKMEDGSTRDNIADLYLNYMYDAGLTARFIFAKSIALDLNAQFANFRVGGYNVMNITVGAAMGLRL